MTALELLLVLAVAVAGVWLVGAAADAWIGRHDWRITRAVRARAPQARQVLVRCRADVARAYRAGRRLTRA